MGAMVMEKPHTAGHGRPYRVWIYLEDRGFPSGSMLKNLPAMQGTQVQSLGWEDSLEKRMATHSSILAWRIPWQSLEGYSPWSHKESDTTE